MKKLRLQMDDLAVESFTTSNAGGGRGTVEGHNTLGGDSCGAENTCGPQTCGAVYCVRDTVDPLACGGGGSGGCTSVGCPGPTGMLSCAGCTTYDYTQAGGDTCDYCASRESDSPQRCRCI